MNLQESRILLSKISTSFLTFFLSHLSLLMRNSDNISSEFLNPAYIAGLLFFWSRNICLKLNLQSVVESDIPGKTENCKYIWYLQMYDQLKRRNNSQRKNCTALFKTLFEFTQIKFNLSKSATFLKYLCTDRFFLVCFVKWMGSF